MRMATTGVSLCINVLFPVFLPSRLVSNPPLTLMSYHISTSRLQSLGTACVRVPPRWTPPTNNHCLPLSLSLSLSLLFHVPFCHLFPACHYLALPQSSHPSVLSSSSSSSSSSSLYQTFIFLTLSSSSFPFRHPCSCVTPPPPSSPYSLHPCVKSIPCPRSAFPLSLPPIPSIYACLVFLLTMFSYICFSFLLGYLSIFLTTLSFSFLVLPSVSLTSIITGHVLPLLAFLPLPLSPHWPLLHPNEMCGSPPPLV